MCNQFNHAARCTRGLIERPKWYTLRLSCIHVQPARNCLPFLRSLSPSPSPSRIGWTWLHERTWSRYSRAVYISHNRSLWFRSRANTGASKTAAGSTCGAHTHTHIYRLYQYLLRIRNTGRGWKQCGWIELGVKRGSNFVVRARILIRTSEVSNSALFLSISLTSFLNR